MNKQKESGTSIFIVLGGKGVAGHTMVQSLIIQYPENKLKVKVIPDVQSENKICGFSNTESFCNSIN